MSTPFDARDGLIVVTARVTGPLDFVHVQLALDTGATTTMLSPAHLIAVGYDPAVGTERVRVTTGSGVEFAPRVTIERMEALEQERTNFAVLAHTLPPSAGVDGLLGLDFLRGQRVIVDFRTGAITLE